MALQEILAHLHADIALVNEAQFGLNTACTDASKVKTLQEFDICVFWISSFYVHADNVVFEVNLFLNWDSEFITNGRLLELTGLRREDLEKYRNSYGGIASNSDRQRKDFTASYVSVFGDIIARRALDGPLFSTEEYLSYNCQERASGLLHDADQTLVGR